MKNFRYPFLFATVLFVVSNIGCSSNKIQEGNVVATYGNDKTVQVNELNKYIQDWLYYKKFNDRSEIYNHALNDFLINQFKRMDFFEKGLDKDSNLIKSINRIINEELVSEYFDAQYLNKYSNEDAAKKVYGIMDRTVDYQLIALNKPANANSKQLDSLLQKAYEIKSQVVNGHDFADLVKKYSQNEISLMNNGYMPPVDWKQSISDAIQDSIFNLTKGNITVLNGLNTVFIVRILGENKIHVESFDSIKSDIVLELKKAFAKKSLDEYEKDKNALLDINNIKWNVDALNKIVKWSNIPSFYDGEYNQIIEEELNNEGNTIIADYDKGKIDLKEFRRLLNDILVMKYYQGIKVENVKKFIVEALSTDMIVKKAESLGLKKNIFNPFTDNAALKNKMAFLYNKVEIEDKIPTPSEEDLIKFFKNNENTLYYQLEKRNLFVMEFPSEIEANEVSEKIYNGVPYEKVTGNYLVKTYIKDRNGKIDSFFGDEIPKYGEYGFTLNESEISRPVKIEDENNQVKYAIIKCYKIREERQLTFNDVRDKINDDYKNYYRNKIENEVQLRLKEKYKPVINEEVLEKLIATKKG